jgi:hypothetical protein
MNFFKKLPIQVRDPFHEHLEARGKVTSVSEGTTRWVSDRGKELESSEGPTRCASGHGKEFEPSEGTTRWASGCGKELESSEDNKRWASGRGKGLESSEGTTRWASGRGKGLESSEAVNTVITPLFEKKLSASDMYPFAHLDVPTAFAEVCTTPSLLKTSFLM